MCIKKIINYFKKSNKATMENPFSDDSIKEMEQAWQEFEKDLTDLKRKQIEIIKKYKEKLKNEELA